MKVIKFLFLTIFSFAVISCSNIYNQGEASLEICLPGSPDYDARFIDIPDTGAFGQYLMGAFFQIILDGPVHAEQIIEYGNPCVFDNLKSGRYKLSIYTWSQDPVSGSQWNQLYCYGEKDIAVFSGKNTRAMDVYALSINNIEEITGAHTTVQFMYDGSYEVPEYLSVQTNDISIISFSLNGCTTSYRGGYRENYDNLIGLPSSYTGYDNWVIYKDGKVVCRSTDQGKTYDFYPHEPGYEMVYTYDTHNIQEKKIKLRSAINFIVGH